MLSCQHKLIDTLDQARLTLARLLCGKGNSMINILFRGTLGSLLIFCIAAQAFATGPAVETAPPPATAEGDEARGTVGFNGNLGVLLYCRTEDGTLLFWNGETGGTDAFKSCFERYLQIAEKSNPQSIAELENLLKVYFTYKGVVGAMEEGAEESEPPTPTPAPSAPAPPVDIE